MRTEGRLRSRTLCVCQTLGLARLLTSIMSLVAVLTRFPACWSEPGEKVPSLATRSRTASMTRAVNLMRRARCVIGGRRLELTLAPQDVR